MTDQLEFQTMPANTPNKADPKRLGYARSTNGSPKRESNEWFTPVEYIEAARAAMDGHIDLDPFSCKEANDVVKAKYYFTKEDNALNRRWTTVGARTIWMNPPYSRGMIEKCADKFIRSWLTDKFDYAIILVNNATETKWFQGLMAECSSFCLANTRIKFWASDNKNKSGNTRGQFFMYYGRSPEKFARKFRKYGTIYTGRRAVPRELKIERRAEKLDHFCEVASDYDIELDPENETAVKRAIGNLPKNHPLLKHDYVVEMQSAAMSC